jgi:hypothetical protein
MLQKILAPLYSTRLMAVLFLLFAAAMAAGTFIEDAYNTETARILIYNSWWFELIMAFFVINFFGNIYRYQLQKKEKWATLLLHLSFILILIGAFVTRYISFEGMMLIREGESSNTIYSDMPYVTAFVDGMYKGEMKRKTIEKQALFSKAVNNSLEINDDFDGQPFTIELQEFILNAKQTFKPNSSGKLYLKLVEASQGGRKEHYLVEGEVKMINNILFSFNKPTQGAITILKSGDTYDRFCVRNAEVWESLKIIRQALDKLPEGPYHADVPDYYLPPKEDVYNNMEALIYHFKIVMGEVPVPVAEVYHPVEGGNGELGFYLITDGSRTPYRLHFRRPCFIYYQAYPEMIKGAMLSDAIAILSSLNVIAGELDA